MILETLESKVNTVNIKIKILQFGKKEINDLSLKE